VSSSGLPFVRRAANDDARAVAQLLHDFNREFDEPTPAVGELTERISRLLDGGDTVVLLVGDNPDGLAVLRLRAAIWSSGLECYPAELYVAPARRGRGFGRALVEAGFASPERGGMRCLSSVARFVLRAFCCQIRHGDEGTLREHQRGHRRAHTINRLRPFPAACAAFGVA
jgi:GNAT superfamily N-acetyltransferase